MPPLGKAPESQAKGFVADYPEAALGSMSPEGLRRVRTAAEGKALTDLRKAFGEMAGAFLAPIRPGDRTGQCQPCDAEKAG